MATTLRKLPSKSRAELQFEIDRLVHHAEMEALYARTLCMEDDDHFWHYVENLM